MTSFTATREPSSPIVQTGTPLTTAPGIRRLSLEHDDLGFLEQAAQLLGFRSQFLQLEAGTNPSRMELLDGGGLSLVRLAFSRRTFITGPKPGGRIFCNLTLQASQQQPRVHGRRLDADTLVGFDPQQEIHFQAPAGHRFAVLLVEEALFWQTAATMGRRDLEPDTLRANAFRTHPRYAPELRLLLNRLFDAGAQGTSGKLALEARRHQELHDNLLPLLIAAIETPHHHHQLQISRNERLQIANAVQELMRERLADPLSLRDLYEAVPTSRRTLAYAFDEVFGLPPMRFLRLHRLRCARRALTEARADQTMVIAIAQRYGFSSASHFSRAYRQHFGESPLQTLTYNQKQLGWSSS